MEDLKSIGAEVCAVLKKVSSSRYNKIPKEITDIFEAFEEESKNVVIEIDIPFECQKISKEAKDIIFLISLNYWLTEEKRQMVKANLKENEFCNDKTDISVSKWKDLFSEKF